MRKTLIWILAFLIGAGTLVYQRMTGPTYPKTGRASVGGVAVKYRLPRSALITADAPVFIKAPEPLTGALEYKRFKTEDGWTKTPLERKDDSLLGVLPKQPMAGKLLYRVVLSGPDGAEVALAGGDPVAIRFRGEVPVWVLIPHVLAMLLAIIFAARAGLAALNRSENPLAYAKWAALFLFIAGFILGPLMQHFGFGQLWAGFPAGHDLTDNKTLICMIAWIVALRASRKASASRAWILGAAILMFVVFLIPHSVLGSELDYSKISPPAAAPLKLP